jgi:hypothetical protein
VKIEVIILNNLLQILLLDIENCRNEMIRTAAATSLVNPEVMETSKKLDGLLNKYHFLSGKK